MSLMTQSGHRPSSWASAKVATICCPLGATMRRREFITLLGTAAAACPLVALAQPATVIGFLRPSKAEESGHLVAALREGLRDSGYPADKDVSGPRWWGGAEVE